MSDTAREASNYQTVDTASTEGLSDFFDDHSQTLISDQNESTQTLNPTQINPEHWSLQDAANKLNISVITVRRRLQKGTLKGYKIQGSNGPEWRVISPNYSTPIIDKEQPDPTLVADHSHTKQTPANPDQAVITALLVRLSDIESKLLDSQNALQSATWRNGYLESKLEERDNQVKLLTDSQHKPGWWAKFSSWFFKGQ